jgi:hypothetical protein
MDCARLALAVLRCKARHGTLPEGLDALVPEFVEAVPPDPFDGKPLRYRKAGDRFVVYAVGRDGKDDGGEIRFNEKTHTNPDTGFGVRWPQQSR